MKSRVTYSLKHGLRWKRSNTKRCLLKQLMHIYSICDHGITLYLVSGMVWRLDLCLKYRFQLLLAKNSGSIVRLVSPFFVIYFLFINSASWFFFQFFLLQPHYMVYLLTVHLFINKLFIDWMREKRQISTILFDYNQLFCWKIIVMNPIYIDQSFYLVVRPFKNTTVNYLAANKLRQKNYISNICVNASQFWSIIFQAKNPFAFNHFSSQNELRWLVHTT